MSPARKSLMRCLGEFVGHVVRGVKSEPTSPRRHTIRREEQLERRGTITLRRTIVEEIELPDEPDRS